MAYGAVSNPWKVSKQRLNIDAKPKDGNTFIVAAFNSRDTNRADYVCSGADDDVVINQALSALPSGGGLIKLVEGTFNISKAIQINTDNISIVGSGRGTNIRTTKSIDFFNANNRTGIIIKDIYLFGTSGGYNSGINMNTVDNCIISKCWFENMSGLVIILNYSTDSIIEDCFIRNISSLNDGIFIGHSSGIIAVNNTVYGGGTGTSYGITLHESIRCTVTGNAVSGTTSNGIWIFISDDCIVEGNNSSDNIADGINCAIGTNNVISNNRCDNNGAWGINIVALSLKNIVMGNQLVGNTSGGATDSGTSTEMAHNIVA
jgi:parallel beta-helix repeat protein